MNAQRYSSFSKQPQLGIYTIQRKLRNIDKVKYFIGHEGKAAKVEGNTTQYFDGIENGGK